MDIRVIVAHSVGPVAKAVTIEGPRHEVESFIQDNVELFVGDRVIDEAKELRK